MRGPEEAVMCETRDLGRRSMATMEHLESSSNDTEAWHEGLCVRETFNSGSKCRGPVQCSSDEMSTQA